MGGMKGQIFGISVVWFGLLLLVFLGLVVLYLFFTGMLSDAVEYLTALITRFFGMSPG